MTDPTIVRGLLPAEPQIIRVLVPGQPGASGLSAYQQWLAAGNSGSEAVFLASLTGDGAADPGDLTLIFDNRLI